MAGISIAFASVLLLLPTLLTRAPARVLPQRRPPGRRAAGPAQGQPPADHPTMAQTVSRSRSHATEATLLDTSDLEEHAQHLGEEVGHADDKLTARLHARFDHRLGGLGSGEMISDDDTVATTVATVWSLELVRMLRNSQSLRQAVIMSEVLSPPEHRW